MAGEPEFVGCAEIEEIFNIPHHRTVRFHRRGWFPPTIAPLKCGLVFRTAEVRKAITRLRNRGQL